LIREVWQALWGEDVVTTGREISRDQFRVLCPYHKESNASCDVHLAKDSFICRSCGANGGWSQAIILAGNCNTVREAYEWAKSHGVRII
jgi:CHC2 zinc finger